jgi:hypothetical protein
MVWAWRCLSYFEGDERRFIGDAATFAHSPIPPHPTCVCGVNFFHLYLCVCACVCVLGGGGGCLLEEIWFKQF